MSNGWDPQKADDGITDRSKFIAYEPENTDPDYDLERYNTMPVRGPDEVDNMLFDVFADLKGFRNASPEAYAQFLIETKKFQQDWRSYWAIYWDKAENVTHYELLPKRFKLKIQPLLTNASFDNNSAEIYEVLSGWVSSLTNRSALPTSDETGKPPPSHVATGAGAHKSASKITTGLSLDEYIEEFRTPKFERPIFIVAAPRSGSTMLFEAVQQNKDLWSIGDEIQREVETIPPLHPENRGYESNALSADDFSPQIGALLMDALMGRLQNAGGVGYSQLPEEYRPKSIRILEKTPKNSLRIPFFREMFPDAKFIFLHRNARTNIASIIDAWRSQKFVTYARLPGWSGLKWSLLLPNGWQNLNASAIAEIAAWQWAQTNSKIMDDLSGLPREDWTSVSYEGLLHDPGATLKDICAFADIPFGPKMAAFATAGFPRSRYTLAPPREDKWKQHAAAIDAAAHKFVDVEAAIKTFA